MLNLIFWIVVLIILIALLIWFVLVLIHLAFQKTSAKKDSPSEEDVPFLCPNCGAPAEIHGTSWECPWCGDFGELDP